MVLCTIDDGTRYFDRQLLCHIMNQKHIEAQLMLQSSSDCQNSTDDSGATLLHYTAQYGNATMSQYLIDLGCSKIDWLDESGNSPLMLAVKYEHASTIETLLKANADVYIRDSIGRTILQSVLQSGAVTRSRHIIDLFINRVRVMCCDDDWQMSEKLIEAGCNVVQAMRVNRASVVRLMLEKGCCSVEDRDVNCNTALHLAVESMNLDLIKILVQHKARVNARGCHGSTPLLKYNVKFKDGRAKLQILQYLLHHGASLTMQDLFGMSPLTLLLCGADRDTLQVVMRHAVDLTEHNKFHQSPLHYLAANPNPGVFEAIRAKTFRVDACDSQNFTPLMLAVKHYDLEKVQFLLEHGANVNARSCDGHSCLILLFMNRLEDEKNIGQIVELLLQHGADVQATFKSNTISLFDLAEKHDYFCRIKPVISRLVMRQIQGDTIDPSIRQKIRSNFVFNYHYDKCRQQIKQLRYKIVHGSVSLFKLLYQSEDKLALYARNSQFQRRFASLLAKANSHVDAHVFNTLSARVNKAIRLAEIRRVSSLALCRLTALPISTCSTILYKILDYLAEEDFQQLNKLYASSFSQDQFHTVY